MGVSNTALKICFSFKKKFLEKLHKQGVGNTVLSYYSLYMLQYFPGEKNIRKSRGR